MPDVIPVFFDFMLFLLLFLIGSAGDQVLIDETIAHRYQVVTSTIEYTLFKIIYKEIPRSCNFIVRLFLLGVFFCLFFLLFVFMCVRGEGYEGRGVGDCR